MKAYTVLNGRNLHMNGLFCQAKNLLMKRIKEKL